VIMAWLSMGPLQLCLIDVKDVVSEYPEMAKLKVLTDKGEQVKIYLRCVKDHRDILRFKLGTFKEVGKDIR